jgi:hypothetical protein
MSTDTIKSEPCDKNVLFDLAKEIYALHCAIKQISNIPARNAYRNELIERLEENIKNFTSCGGMLDSGNEVFGEKAPILSYPEAKEVFPYIIGRMRCEELVSIFR